MAQEFIRIQFSEEDGRRKMRFRQRDLRDVVIATEKSLFELLGDQFAGWPYLVLYGLRAYDGSLTLDKASDLMDAWVSEPDPETGAKRTTEDLAKKLVEAMNASGFVKLDIDRKDREPASGNDQQKAATRTE